MSGDSPNALINENVFDFKEGRSSPTPTTSKLDQAVGTSTVTTAGAAVQASVLVEPSKDKKQDKESGENKDEDKPDFSSPILNNTSDDGHKHDEGTELKDFSNKNDDKEHRSDKNKQQEEDDKLLNGGVPVERSEDQDVPDRKEYPRAGEEDESCVVNCLYYTMECCKCTIM